MCAKPWFTVPCNDWSNSACVPLRVTPEGRRAAEGWLRQPVGHARDIRSELLLKLALLDRVGADPEELLRAQRRQLAPIAGALARQIPAAAGIHCHDVGEGERRWQFTACTAVAIGQQVAARQIIPAW